MTDRLSKHSCAEGLWLGSGCHARGKNARSSRVPTEDLRVGRGSSPSAAWHSLMLSMTSHVHTCPLNSWLLGQTTHLHTPRARICACQERLICTRHKHTSARTKPTQVGVRVGCGAVGGVGGVIKFMFPCTHQHCTLIMSWGAMRPGDDVHVIHVPVLTPAKNPDHVLGWGWGSGGGVGW